MSVPTSGSRRTARILERHTRAAIVDFERVTDEGGATVPPDDRVAVFDNDGTLWCEKPMPVELGFILHRFTEMAEEDPALRDRQPWKAAWDKDYAWLGAVITKHYHGDDSDVKVLMGGILQAFAGMTVTAYTARADAFLRQAPHPSLGRLLRDCAYLPMVELLRYLEANGFATYIASGGDRDFMRPVTYDIYGIPRNVSSAAPRGCGTARTEAAGPLSTRRRWTSSTTAR